jgi:3-dehydroquinate dehydratase/shikimate dehydrogenase
VLMIQAILVATLMAPPTVDGEELSSLPGTVNWLEVRADLVSDINPDWLRSHFKGKLLYALRSRIEGGNFEGSIEQRRQRFLEIGKYYDLVELEGDRDLLPEILDAIPPAKRLISWHGPATDCSTLKQRLEEFSATAARAYKLVPMGRQPGDELAALSLLKLANRRDLIAYTTGKASFWSRLLSPYFGMPMIYGTLEKQSDLQGEPTIKQLIEEYNLPKLMPVKEIYGIVGDPVQHSLSPKLHNAAYRALGYPALFMPFHAESFTRFWHDVVEKSTLESLGISMKGFTVASPHKETALSEVAAIPSSMVQRAGSTNIFVRSNGTWKADTTDPAGVVEAMSRRGIRLAGKKVAVVGCGGSGRAIAAALDQAGVSVTLVNRGFERGLHATELLGLPFVPLSKFSANGYSLIVNATPVGRENGDLPFELKNLSQDAVIVDLVYGSHTTPLIAKALAMGRTAIDGREVLYLQVRRQFHLMTGQQMPAALALQLLDMKPSVSAEFLPNVGTHG